jgi:GNAT superfamily N-acetyltransferase
VRAAIEDNLFELLRRVAELPGGELEDSDRMLRIATGLPSPMHNAVVRARLAPEEVEPTVAEVFAWYRRRRAPFFWWTGPQSSPSDLDDRLAAAGLLEFDRDSPGMAMALADIDESAAAPPGVSVEQAHGEDALREWAVLFSAAHDAPPSAGQSWVEAARRRDFRELPWSSWIARLDGEPAGLGLSFVAGDAVGLYAIGTLPQARRRGVGTALTLVPMLEARSSGAEIAILHSTPDGEKLYPRLGFRELCRVSRFLGGA